MWQEKIRKNHGHYAPSHHMVVQTEGRIEPGLTNGGSLITKCEMWASVRWRNEKGIRTRIVYDDGESIADFWDLLYGLLGHGQTLWVWSFDSRQTFSSLRLWEQMEGGYLLLAEPEEVYATRKRGNVRAKLRKGFACIEDPPVILRLFDLHGRSVVFMDIGNWIPGPLAEIFAFANLPKPERHRLYARYDKDRIDCYSVVDAVAECVNSIIRIVLDEDLGVMRYTAASQSFAAFRHRFSAKDVYTHADLEIKTLERESYYGGDTRVFFHGPIVEPQHWLSSNQRSAEGGTCPCAMGPVYHIDVRSLYPYVMSMERYPVFVDRAGSQISPQALLQLGHDFGAIARVRIDSEICEYPYRRKKDYVISAGQYWTVLAWPELRQALVADAVSDVGEFVIYKTDRIFEEFVAHFWTKRIEAQAKGRDALANVYKTILCSLYGKFAQWDIRWETITDDFAMIPWGYYSTFNHETKECNIFRALGWELQKWIGKREKDNNFPAISSFITSYGREHMRIMRAIAGDGEVYYQGTDSLYVSQRGYDRLKNGGYIDASKLGHFAVKGIAQTAQFFAKNCYIFGQQRRMAGLSLDAVEISPFVWNSDVLPSIKTQIAGRPAECIGIKVREYTVTQPRPGGLIGKNGWSKPIITREEAAR